MKYLSLASTWAYVKCIIENSIGPTSTWMRRRRRFSFNGINNFIEFARGVVKVKQTILWNILFHLKSNSMKRTSPVRNANTRQIDFPQMVQATAGSIQRCTLFRRTRNPCDKYVVSGHACNSRRTSPKFIYVLCFPKSSENEILNMWVSCRTFVRPRGCIEI